MPLNVSGVSVKEVVEMIESRIPGGRYVTSILISLLVLTAATASAVYLYHALVLPVVLGVSSLLRTGQIAAPTLTAMLGSFVGSIVLYITFHFSTKVVLSTQVKVLDSYKKVDKGLEMVANHQEAIGRRLDAIESRVTALEQ